METQDLVKPFNRQAVAWVLAAAFMSGGLYFATRLQSAHQSKRVAETIASWPEASRLTARHMIERYGLPDRMEPALTWYRRSPWKRIEVRPDLFSDVLEQTVSYRVDPEAMDRLGGFDHGVTADMMAGELTARADREPLNFLALNLADDVASGRRDAAEARQFYEKTARLAASGKSSEYMQGLRFAPYSPLPMKFKDFNY